MGHQHGVIHKDVKPDNIIFNANGVPILSDFGISKVVTSNTILMSQSSAGTVEYLAPEVLTRSHRHGAHSDFWSLGVVGYELLFKRHPFRSHCNKAMIVFADKHYTSLWDRVVSENKLLDQRDWEAPVDWDALTPDQVNATRYPAPDILETSPLLSDELCVAIPPATACLEATSAACIDLLQGLLEIRIPKRLGTGCQFLAFRNHAFFCGYNISENIEKKEAAPFIPDVARVATYLKAKYAERNYVFNANMFLEDEDVVLSMSKRAKLDSVQYVPANVLWNEAVRTNTVPCNSVAS